MIQEILAKIISEALLSLYPIFVKFINIPIVLQIWSRFITYSFISLFFINWKYIFSNIFSKNGLLLSLITIIHVYVSYRGFQLLESGISYVIFYTYPLFILLFAGKKVNILTIGLILLGVYLLSQNSNKKEEIDESFVKNENDKIFKKNDEKEYFWQEGVIMILLAAITEAFIYFLVLNLKTENNWNHIFISYFFGAFAISAYYLTKKDLNVTDTISIKNNSKITVYISLLINGIIGLFGYVLRFYAIGRLNTTVYAMLSYLGIIMAYVYGVIFNKDDITFQKIIGSLLILIPIFIEKKN
jgi:drug/metabolite transporter (DMT)-like permease